jgi:hypothetical protein
VCQKISDGKGDKKIHMYLSFFLFLKMNFYTLFLCLAIFVFALLIGIIMSEVLNTNVTSKRESFLLTPQGAQIDRTSGALKGVGLMTDGMINRPWSEIEDSVNKTGFGFDGGRTLGVGITDNQLNTMFQNHQDILALDAQAENGMRTREEINEISKKLVTGANNANNNLYSRGGSYPTKMVLAQNEIRGVIDEKYLPERDKSRKIAVVSSVIHTPGFDINTERLGVNLADTHFSNVSRNKATKRVPSAAGAVGSSLNKELDVDAEESPNSFPINQKVKIEGNNVVLQRDAAGVGQSTEIITAPIEDEDIEEEFRPNYALNNIRIKKKK